jgi:hypothetical protein
MSENRRSTDDTINKMAGDIGYIRSKLETLVTDSQDHDNRLKELEGNKKTARGILIGATVLAGTTGSAIHTALSKILDHLTP